MTTLGELYDALLDLERAIAVLTRAEMAIREEDCVPQVKRRKRIELDMARQSVARYRAIRLNREVH